MGFRNPLTVSFADLTGSLDFADITGFVAGSQLSAEAIDGKVITGATFQTAAAGKRLTIDSADQSKIVGFSGVASELEPAYIQMLNDPALDASYIEIQSANIDENGTARILMGSGHTALFDLSPGTIFWAEADEGHVGNMSWFYGGLAYDSHSEFDFCTLTRGEVQSSSKGSTAGDYGQFRALGGNYGFLIRNDGATTNFLLTAQYDQNGVWSALRPLAILNASGKVVVGTEFTATKAIQSGTINHASIAAGGSLGGSVVFPTAMSATPSVVITPGSGRLTGAVSAISATGFTWGLNNWTAALSGVTTTKWIAIV